MEKLMKLSAVILITVFAVACGASSKDDVTKASDKKAALEALKKDREALNDKITKLEAEIAKTDPNGAGEKAKLVAVTPVQTQNFEHFIDLQGKVATENIYYVTPRGMGGQVRAIYVKQGDNVKKGQLVMKLEDAVMLQNLKQLETQLSFAKNLYERQKNLWDQGIGTEVQYLTAKNNVDNLEKQISVTKEQWNTSNVYSEVSGVVETVNIRVGENFTGLPTSGITIVNPSNLKVVVDVPENYLSKVKKGVPVVINVGDIDKEFKSSISFVSELINANSRGFTAEAKIPADNNLKPNQLATVKVKDYSASNAIIIPITTLQTDDKGKYVYVLATENGKKVARKKQVTAGEVYGERIEIRQGLAVDDQLITQGYQSLYDGQLVTTTDVAAK